MIVRTELDPSCTDVEVTVRCRELDGRVERLVALLRSASTLVRCQDGGAERLVAASEIYYAESVDKRTFVYLEKSVYPTELRLYQLAETLSHAGFVQVSRSCVLNVNFLRSIRPLLNSHMEAALKNGERIRVNRRYLNGLKQALKGDLSI